MAPDVDPALARHIADLWPRERMDDLFTAGEDVKVALGSAGVQAIERVLTAELAALDRALDGRLHDHAQYAYMHGRRSALMAMFEAAHAIVVSAERLRAQQAELHEGEPEPLAA